MSERPDLLVIGNSARFGAASAVRAGFAVAAIDAFGDTDTRACASRFLRADSIGAEALADAALRLSERPDAPRRVVYGAGLDARPDQLRRLEERFEVVGNSADSTEAVACPRRLFALLEALGIPFPPVSHVPPADPAGWLLKRLASSGGLGVLDAVRRGPALPRDAYFQRLVDGAPVSAVFAADGRSVRILGYSRLRTLALPEAPFAYAGAVAWPAPPAALRSAATAYARRLTGALGLRGINGIDLLLPSGRGGAQTETAAEPLLLELNMRPPATLELHEGLGARSGMSTHLAAAAGVLPGFGDSLHPWIGGTGVRGVRVLYAEDALTVPAADWPCWCSDRPAAGTMVPAGAPLCTVHAGGVREVDVQALLDSRAAMLLSGLCEGRRRAA